MCIRDSSRHRAEYLDQVWPIQGIDTAVETNTGGLERAPGVRRQRERQPSIGGRLVELSIHVDVGCPLQGSGGTMADIASREIVCCCRRGHGVLAIGERPFHQIGHDIFARQASAGDAQTFGINHRVHGIIIHEDHAPEVHTGAGLIARTVVVHVVEVQLNEVGDAERAGQAVRSPQFGDILRGNIIPVPSQHGAAIGRIGDDALGGRIIHPIGLPIRGNEGRIRKGTPLIAKGRRGAKRDPLIEGIIRVKAERKLSLIHI